MSEINQFTRIIFYGCSFTAGAELSDHEYAPNLTIDQVDDLKRKIKHEFYSKYNVDWSELAKRDYEKSWAKSCADQLGLEYVNKATLGASMDEITYYIEMDLASGFIKDTDIIFVGITSANRIFRFDQYHRPTSLCLHDADPRWQNSRIRDKFILDFGDDYTSSYKWYKDVKYLDLLSTKLNGRILQQYVWASYSANLSWMEKTSEQRLEENFRNLICSMIDFDSLLDPEFSFSTIVRWDNPEDCHTFLHPKQHKHQEFANHIVYLIDKKLRKLYG